jgi:hypothetical protein
VVASLPRPIDRSKGRYVVGEVYGGVPGSKKRKRSELAVGIDGEGVNLYDVRYKSIVSSTSNKKSGVGVEIDHLICAPSTIIFHLSALLVADSSFEEQS